jgi:hypothetical protein
MSLNGVGVVDTAHVFSCAVIHVAVNLLAAEIRINKATSLLTIEAVFDVFTEIIGSSAYFVSSVTGQQLCGRRVQQSQIP